MLIRKHGPEIQCKICGNLFQPRRTNAVTCGSPNCQVKTKERAPRQWTKNHPPEKSYAPEIQRTICGNLFQRREGHSVLTCGGAACQRERARQMRLQQFRESQETHTRPATTAATHSLPHFPGFFFNNQLQTTVHGEGLQGDSRQQPATINNPSASTKCLFQGTAIGDILQQPAANITPYGKTPSPINFLYYNAMPSPLGQVVEQPSQHHPTTTAMPYSTTPSAIGFSRYDLIPRSNPHMELIDHSQRVQQDYQQQLTTNTIPFIATQLTTGFSRHNRIVGPDSHGQASAHSQGVGQGNQPQPTATPYDATLQNIAFPQNFLTPSPYPWEQTSSHNQRGEQTSQHEDSATHNESFNSDNLSTLIHGLAATVSDPSRGTRGTYSSEEVSASQDVQPASPEISQEAIESGAPPQGPRPQDGSTIGINPPAGSYPEYENLIPDIHFSDDEDYEDFYNVYLA
ncbi:hypothetical protein CHU98_g7345 [Xylaria longipes]|nr:hypothetical protein CHU98_g7345 [Xylaria longipes]